MRRRREDHKLGLDRELPRRDFLQGMLMGAALTLSAPLRRAYVAQGAAQDAPGYYNHDDFGGHAKRNEFLLDGRMHLMNGGTLSIESPRPYSAQAEGLIRSVGIDVEALQKTQRFRFLPPSRLVGFGTFDRETFGVDRLVQGPRGSPRAIAQYPLSARARADILRMFRGRDGS
jgi:hypothetical protein